jgi:GxxExxY protein
VHRELGPGLIEAIYGRALSIELGLHGISYETERATQVRYRGHVVGSHRIDIVVENQVIVELKAVDRLGPLHLAQVLSSLRVANLRIALLENFLVPVLSQGVKRVVL